MDKLYFENEDSENAFNEDYFQELMKTNGEETKTVIEAIPTTFETSDYVYCKDIDDCVEKIDCRKNCDSYIPADSDKCMYEGTYCEFGNEVILKLKIK